jgi:hypothetical protein
MRALPVTLTMSLFVVSAVTAQYSGGTGEPNNPHQIATAADLIALGEMPGDYDKHFLLTADIDLDPNLPGRTVFDNAVIAPKWETPFTGFFGGNRHTISHLATTGAGYLGLFGGLKLGGTIKDLGVIDVNISESGGQVGALVAYSEGEITNCYSSGTVTGDGRIGGLVGFNDGRVNRCYSASSVRGTHEVGGLVGYNTGTLTQCYSIGAVRGSGWASSVGGLAGVNFSLITCRYSTAPVSGFYSVGGLVGDTGMGGHVSRCYSSGVVCGDDVVGGLVGGNYGGSVVDCYSTSPVHGTHSVGGLVGSNSSEVSHCYSTGVVHGDDEVGGLVGSNLDTWGHVINCFWDIRTSVQVASAGGEGRATDEMQTAATFLQAGWDFVGETKNGRQDLWLIREGQEYPKLRELSEDYQPGPVPAFCPEPQDGAIEITQSPILSWVPGRPGLRYDVYFGDDEGAVVHATIDSLDIYRGRQLPEMTTYEPGHLAWGETYYWRIGGVNESDPNSLRKDSVWSFTTADFLVVDDFESYSDDDNRIYETWIDGWFNGTGSLVLGWWGALMEPPVHGGRQSMPFSYDNAAPPYYSEVYRTWDAPQDWAIYDALTLYFHGRTDNEGDSLYVALVDRDGRTAVVVHPDPGIVGINKWTRWTIPFSDFTSVNAVAIKSLCIGVGNRDNPQPGGIGQICIDDIRLTKRTP